MAETIQNYENHTRWHPPFHFFLAPLLLLNFIFAAVQLFRFRDLDHAWWLVLAVGLIVLGALARMNALRVQDRLIRLEEQVRYQQILPQPLAQSATGLRLSQILALRFASDGELPGLVQQVIDGNLLKGDDIKRAVKDWRADNLRV
ncbi:MAG TPA: DUF6526 family protein [Pyrinomonadaceae bacterium]